VIYLSPFPWPHQPPAVTRAELDGVPAWPRPVLRYSLGSARPVSGPLWGTASELGNPSQTVAAAMAVTGRSSLRTVIKVAQVAAASPSRTAPRAKATLKPWTTPAWVALTPCVAM